ncbi:ATP-binding cassette domain-containing protein [Marinicella litoralis]|nr:ABC transporter ATP-binding protein [Marinicella litoralis]
MKLNKLCFTRSGQKILDQIEDDWPSTGVVVLLGANGAGKSTLLDVIAGIKKADSGELILQQSHSKFLMPEPAAFYPYLTVKEQLNFIADMFVNVQPDLQVENAMEVWQLHPVADKLTKNLSLGFRQRLSLAQLALSNADILLLDEPMNGMDPEILSVFKEQVLTWKKTKSVIMATHIMHEAQILADWVVVMFQGKIIRSHAYSEEISFHQIYQKAIDDYHLGHAVNG